MALLNGELEKVNDFFMDKEEEFVIRIHELRGEMDRLVHPHAYSSHAHTHAVLMTMSMHSIFMHKACLARWTAWCTPNAFFCACPYTLA